MRNSETMPAALCIMGTIQYRQKMVLQLTNIIKKEGGIKMRKDFRRKLALFMAGCLVLGSLQMTGFTVQASEFDEVGTDGGGHFCHG